MSDPQAVITQIETFWNLQPFAHDFNNIDGKSVAEDDENAWGIAGLHDVKPELKNTGTSPKEILGEFEYRFPGSNRPEVSAGQPEFPSITLNAAEQAVWDALGRETLEVDPIIRGSGLPPSAVQVALFSLELKRLVRQFPGRRFERVSSEN